MTGRGKKKKTYGTVSAGLLPVAAFSAVPRTPPPETPVGITPGLAMTTGVLKASMLGRLRMPPTGHDEDVLSDPESSLYDYQQMEEPGYSSVEFGRTGGSRKRISYSDRDKAPTPPPGTSQQQFDADNEYRVLDPEAVKREAELSALYATPNKDRKRQSQTVNGQQSLQHTGQRVRAEMKRYHDMEQEDTDNEVEDIIPKVTVERQTTSPHKTPSQRSKRESPDRSHRSGANTARSGANTARSGATTARSHDSLQQSLEGENYILRSKAEQLESEVISLKHVTSALEHGDHDTAMNLMLKKQLQEMKAENETLKNSIHRLTVELSAYQAKFRPLSAEEKTTAGLLGLPRDGPIPSWLIDTKYLSPLFMAYDDRMAEKDKIILKYQEDFDRLRRNAESIVDENEQLQHDLEETATKGPVDIHEWEQLKENAKLILEENQNLLEQINIKDQKAHDLQQAHIREVSKVTKELVMIRAEKSDTDRELEELQRKWKDTKQKHDELIREGEDKTTVDQYINKIADLKKEMLDIEDRHRKDSEELKIKLQAMENERKSQTQQMIELTAEIKRHQAEKKAMHRSMRKTQNKMLYLQRAIEQSETKEQSVQDYLGNIIRVAEKVAQERDNYAKVAKENEIETKKAVNKLLQDNMMKAKLEEKLKLYKMRAAAKINTVSGRLAEQDQTFLSQKKEYEREIKHLRHLIKDKEDLMHGFSDEKRDAEDELEVMWQAAHNENERMKDVLHKTVRQLRQHEALSDAMDRAEPKELVHVSSDEQ
ncbi:centrosomal protein of 89 kDa-like isoform X2 [Mytilus californianus]|uniref:centrosomal protein of 89 kDa-like isoform X2 n=1 Tax=Mytilus californianus TaxID=6549 RepID=UPI002245D057|nr:centrosomal protein of 89 kDa-like isoform X2 [Mytilus californianus]